MKALVALVLPVMLWLRDEIWEIYFTIREKGGRRFMRPVILVILATYGSYAFFHRPMTKKFKVLQNKIEVAKIMFQYAGQYQILHDQLVSFYGELPSFADRANWLTQRAIESMKAENVVSDQILPPEEEMRGSFVFQTIRISLHLNFPEFMAWLKRIEGIRPRVHVSSCGVVKRATPIGNNDIHCAVSTVIVARKVGL